MKETKSSRTSHLETDGSRLVRAKGLEKTPTGIKGLDHVTEGGLPKGRSTLVTGGPGSGKTLLGIQFLVNGVQDHGESGVFLAFEETASDLFTNVASFGIDLEKMVSDGHIVIDHVSIVPSDVTVTGEFDLEALFIRLEHAIDSVGAKRVVIDTMEHLFTGLSNPLAVRMEMRRLFLWLKEKGLTVVITAERGETTLTREGIEEYVSDCVLLLEQNVVEQVTTRRLRIIKYRGSPHGTNQYPFVIDESGFVVAPITGASLTRDAPHDRLPMGSKPLDELIGGDGIYRGSTVLVSGTSGTGKTTVAAKFAQEATRRGDRVIYYSYEESPQVLLRDLKAVGIDLESAVASGALHFKGVRPTSQGLDMHLAKMRRHILEIRPDIIILDPITGFSNVGSMWEMKNMLVLLMDSIGEMEVTTMMTSLSDPQSPVDSTDIGISSLVDVWIILRDVERQNTRRNELFVLKARGIGHSREICEYEIREGGLQRRPSGAQEDAH